MKTYDPSQRQQKEILEALSAGPSTWNQVQDKVVRLNLTIAYTHFREDFNHLLRIGRITRIGVTPDGNAYLFALAS